MRKKRKFLQTKAALEKKEMLDHSACEECMEDYVFAMKDKHHEFSIGLTTILECLSLAEKEGAVPKLPNDWWIEVENRF